MKSKYGYAIISKRTNEIKILDLYTTKDVMIEKDEYWQAVEIKPIKEIPKRPNGYNHRSS